MKFRAIPKRIALLLPLAFFLGIPAGRAAVSFDVAVGMNVNEDTRIFLNITNQTWQPTVPATVVQRCRYPEDDFPVVAFLAYHSHRDPNFILRLRTDGYSWSEIFYRVHVDPGVLFVGIDRDPGPPYGKAWGYWRNNSRHGHHAHYRFSDRDVVGLVKVQTVSRHFGTSPFSVIDAQRHGERMEAYSAGRWRQKNGRQTWSENHGQDHGRGGDQGRGHDDRGNGSNKNHGNSGNKGKGNGQDKNHDHGKDHDR
jgi:hypothetical protein